MSGLLYVASILCILLFSVASGGMLEMDGILGNGMIENFIHYIGLSLLGFGIFSSSLLGYLGYKMRIEEVKNKEVNDNKVKEDKSFRDKLKAIEEI